MKSRVWQKAAICIAVVAAGCDGRPSLHRADSVEGELRGRVVMGRASDVVVTAYKIVAPFTRDRALASTVADESGAFRMSVRGVHGTILLVATSGTFVDQASGVRASLEGTELTYVLREHRRAGASGNILISPISHWVTGLIAHGVRSNRGLQSAHDDAWRHLNEHFGDVDWRWDESFDATAQERAHDDNSMRMGVILAGISMFARGIADANNQMPGAQVNTLSVTRAVYDDVDADGYFDGIGAQGPIVVQRQRLDGHTVRTSLALAVKRFAQSERNVAQLDAVAVDALAHELSHSTNPNIFRDAGSELDDQPPLLSWADDGPRRFANRTNVTFKVLASDGRGMGVARVYAQRADDLPVEGRQVDGVWYLTVEIEKSRNIISIWAQDNAVPPNSGRRLEPPFQLTTTVTYDDVRPELVDAPVPSSYDERLLELETDATGIPQVPAVLRTPSTATKIAISAYQEADVYKLAHRLSWGNSPPSAEALEGMNPNNIPFLRFSVTSKSDDDAPAESAKFLVTISCPGCAETTSHSGSLMRHDSGLRTRFFYLPLSAETIPQLADAAGSPVALLLRVTATDAAGNEDSIRVADLRVHIVAPPLAIAQDATYESTDDRNNVRNYRIADQTYHGVYSGGPVIDYLLPPPVEVARLIVYNPYSVGVAVRIRDETSSGEITERRDWVGNRTLNSAFWKIDGSIGNATPDHPCRYKWPLFDSTQFHIASNKANGQLECISSVNQKYPHEWPPEFRRFDRIPSLNTKSVHSVVGEHGRPLTEVPAAIEGKPGTLALYLRRDPLRGWNGYTSQSLRYWVLESKHPCDCVLKQCDTCGQFVEYEARTELRNARETFTKEITLLGEVIRADGLRTLGDGRGIITYKAMSEVVH